MKLVRSVDNNMAQIQVDNYVKSGAAKRKTPTSGGSLARKASSVKDSPLLNGTDLFATSTVSPSVSSNYSGDDIPNIRIFRTPIGTPNLQDFEFDPNLEKTVYTNRKKLQ